MAKEKMRRKASDNEYLHKDFHGALSNGIEYLDINFGEDAVREYLRRFTKAFYGPLIEQVKARGLIALKEHFERVYAIEGGDASIDLAGDVLAVEVKQCPAVSHMRSHGYSVARLWVETTRTVNEALCEGTPYQAELLDYDEQTGAGIQRFTRRAR